MSIPKVLHYCWFGGAPKPKNIQNCIRSWKKYCPDYEIIEWNEQNFDVSQSLYTRQAYDARRWAFVADYARLKILYEQGGIYMDTDVELLRPLDDLLAYPAFFGFQHNNEVATGLGFGAEARSPVVKALLDDYDGLPFLLPDGSCDLTPLPETKSSRLCPVRHPGRRHPPVHPGDGSFSGGVFLPGGLCRFHLRHHPQYLLHPPLPCQLEGEEPGHAVRRRGDGAAPRRKVLLPVLPSVPPRSGCAAEKMAHLNPSASGSVPGRFLFVCPAGARLHFPAQLCYTETIRIPICF